MNILVRLLYVLLLSLLSCNQERPQQKTWIEENKMLVIEAEEGIFPQGSTGWKKEKEFPGYTGEGYVIWRGESNWGPESKAYDSISPNDVISYEIEIANPGTYYVKVLNYHRKEDGDNDVWTSVNKGEWGKTYDWQVGTWTLDERGDWARRRLEKGRNIIEIAGRSVGFAIDQIVLYEESVKRNPLGAPDSGGGN